MRSARAKKPLVWNKTIIRNGSWFTEQIMQPVVTETQLQIWKK